MTRLLNLWILLLLAMPALADAADAESKLSGLGWAFMLCSIAGVWALAIFCYKKLLFDDE